MTASPLSSDIYDQVPAVDPFDLYRPTARQFTTGAFPVKTFQSQNGAEIRILYGNRLTGKKLTLTYANINDDAAYHFIQHYVSKQGSYQIFSFADSGQDGVRSGWSGAQAGLGANAWGMQWRYAAEPTIQSVFKGRSTVTIELIAVPRP